MTVSKRIFMTTLYHVTEKKNLKSILENGLIPQIGERSKQLNESPAIFLFDSVEKLNDALMNWLGDEFEDIDLVSLKIETSNTLEYNEFEVILRELIPSINISLFREE